MKYLIVEDDFSDVVLLRLKLKRIGCDVTVIDPWDAVQENKENRPDVVQLDGLGGRCFELHEQMKNDNPDAEYLLFSARRELYGEASKAGMAVFDKARGDRDLCEYIGKLLER